MAVAIELNEDEIMDALRFVHRVRENKKLYEVTDKKFDRNNSSYSVNLMGQLGELACGKGLGLQVDRTITPSGDNGHDLVTPLGKNIQVKTSTLPQLIFNAPELFVSDVAVLVQFFGDKQLPHVDSRFELVGWVTREVFLANHYKHDYGYGTRLVMDANQLQPIEVLIDEISRLH
jgi:hypothetical protein